MSPPLVFLFSGQGSQYHRMGERLRDTEPVFRATLDRLDAVVADELGESVVTRMYGRPRTEVFDDTVLTHPAIVMVELALAETLAHHGLRPALLLGASLGEYTAAVLAGVLDEATCLRVLVRQARALRDAPPGGMLAILGDERLHAELPQLREHTDIAARNFPGHFVVAGPDAALSAAGRALDARGVPHQRVPVAHAFHSRLMDPGRRVFDETMATVELRPPTLPLISCTRVGRVDQVTVEHLWRVTREPIEFAATITALEAGGPHHYLDLGPSGTLHNFVRNLLPEGSRSRSMPLLSPFTDDDRLLARVRAELTATRTTRRARTMRVFGFPGQGAQAKGMGADLFDRFPRETATADAVLGYSIRELCVADPRRELRQTRFTQPALYVVSALAYLRAREEDDTPPDFLAGHSLGEYVALLAAGSFDFGTGLRLVQRRGELMSRAEGGGMAAVLGCDLNRVRRLLDEHDLDGLDIANHNAPEQFVLAGPADQLDRARPIFEGEKAHFVRLNVSAPFHSRYMRAAADEFAAFLDGFTLRDPELPVIANLDARPYAPGAVRHNLAEQIASPVRWTETVRFLMGQGDFTFTELGPGRVLTNLVTKIRATAEPFSAAAPVPVDTAREPVPAVAPVAAGEPVSAAAPVASYPQWPRQPAAGHGGLGAPGFRERYGLTMAYLTGSMYGGVSGPALLTRIAKAGGMGFLGTGGLSLDDVGSALRAVRRDLGDDGRYGANLLYLPDDPERELRLVDLLLAEGVTTVEASGFLRITPALVKYRLHGGRVLAKVSRVDQAEAFLSPPPERVVAELRERGHISAGQARRAGERPVADDLCVEIGGGWYESTGLMTTLLPAVLRLRDRCGGTGPYVHVGAAGGIGSPEAAAAAFLMGADFVLTGSVNQCTPEAATSDAVKEMLAGAQVHDVASAPVPDLFELGVRAQVLKRGVFLPARAAKLHELWRTHRAFDQVDAGTRGQVERTYLRRPFAEAAGGEPDPKAAMARAFRSYLDEGFDLAVRGEPDRRVDYLVYCGSAMGAFNEWVAGTGLEPWAARHVDTIAERLMESTGELLRDRSARFVASAGGSATVI